MMEVEMVDVDDIRTTQDVARLSPEIMGRAMDMIRDGWDVEKVPPIKGYFYTDGVDMTDGHHRYAAAVELGYKEVPVVNEAAMKRGDKASYAAAVRKYRRAISHPLAR